MSMVRKWTGLGGEVDLRNTANKVHNYGVTKILKGSGSIFLIIPKSHTRVQELLVVDWKRKYGIVPLKRQGFFFFICEKFWFIITMYFKYSCLRMKHCESSHYCFNIIRWDFYYDIKTEGVSEIAYLYTTC